MLGVPSKCSACKTIHTPKWHVQRVTEKDCSKWAGIELTLEKMKQLKSRSTTHGELERTNGTVARFVKSYGMCCLVEENPSAN